MVRMKTNGVRLLVGLVLLVIGVVVLVYGLVEFDRARGLLGGAVHSVNKFFGTTSKVEQRAIIEMVAGGAAALVGLALLLVRRGSRR
jgi:hypothetical protein